MAKEPDIQRKLDLLEASKPDTRWEGVKGFLSGAWRPAITFGAIGAVVSAVAVGVAAIAGVTALPVIGAGAGAIATGSALAAGTTALLAGGASALKSVNRAKAQNQTINDFEAKLETQAKEAGVQVVSPAEKIAKEKAAEKAKIQEDAKNMGNPDTPQFAKDILARGKRTFDPKEIAGRAISDAREGLGGR